MADIKYYDVIKEPVITEKSGLLLVITRNCRTKLAEWKQHFQKKLPIK